MINTWFLMGGNFIAPNGAYPSEYRTGEAFATGHTIFAGSLNVEFLFSWPGMRRLYYQSATGRDYPMLIAINYALLK